MKDYIKKINLDTVEAELGTCSLECNKVVMGADVSMHNTGLAVIRTTDKYLVLEQTHKIIVPRGIELLKGVDLFLDQLDDFKRGITQKYKLDANIIEDCFFGSNVNTLKALARFGILVYDRLRGISSKTKLVLPTRARNLINFKKSGKAIKGTKLKKEIINYVNVLLGTEIKDTDIADAVVLALSGLVIT